MIERWQPRAIVAVGTIPLWALTGRTGITTLAGSWLADRRTGLPVMPTYHPAYLLRQHSPDLDRAAADLLAQAFARASR